MPHITRALLRKRAEHNEGMISTLEELTLHQEELEEINGVLGATCRRIKILYLQNNIIPRIENLQHLKELEYLNLALNNVERIEGLHGCEFLNKLDLTVNFVDVDRLEESIDHLAGVPSLRELFMLGNPAQSDWPGFNQYVIAKLPQLTHLDGTEITRSMQIQAAQRLPELEEDLRARAAVRAAERVVEEEEKEQQQLQKQQQQQQQSKVEELDDDDDGEGGGDDDVLVEDEEDDGAAAESKRTIEEADEMTEHNPETRTRMYRELAEQKREKEEQQNANMPRERDYEQEQEEAVTDVRNKEEGTAEIEQRQTNQGKWEFSFDDEEKPGYLILDVMLPRHLDSSLIDVDLHPTYVSMVIKSKVLRLKLPYEVRSSEAQAQRSKTTGALRLVMPREDSQDTVGPTLLQRRGVR